METMPVYTTRDPATIFSGQLVEKKEAKILFLTDYHMKKEKVEKLKVWYLSQPLKDISLVVVGGDFDNLTEQNFKKEAENEESEAHISAFLHFLEFFACKIYYVPGNHDPPTLFSCIESETGSRALTQNSINVHKQLVNLMHGLSIVGIGGSIPAKKRNHKTGDVESVWSSFPYEKDEDMESDLSYVQNQVDSCSDQLIFLSHNGPHVSSTTTYSFDEEESIKGGSESLTNFILKNKAKLLINLHGHIHPGQGMSKIELVPIINGGGFTFGEFCTVHLIFDDDISKWKMRSCAFFDLNSYN